MSRIQKNRLMITFLVLLVTVFITVFGVFTLSDNINLFYTPEQIVNGEAPLNTRIKIGGMVKNGSFRHDEGLSIFFIVTDFVRDLNIKYIGILPDLFREGQGVIVFGKLSGSIFFADQVLAKHDEKYMPTEVANMLDKGI